MGRTVNVDKSETMAAPNSRLILRCKDNDIQQVQEFKYLKLRLLNRNMMSILLYARECWMLNIQLEKRVRAFENICLRRLLNIPWQEKVTNIDVRQ